METELRELLQDKAEEIRIDARLPEQMLRRARRRRVGSAVLAGAVAAGLVGGAVVGIRAALPERRVSFADPTQTEQWRGIWPQDSRAEAEAAQAAADVGDSEAVWQRNPVEIAERYGSDVLNWDRVFSSELIAQLNPGVVRVRIGDCKTLDMEDCPTEADLTLEQLLRRGDPSGIWFVTALETAENAPLVERQVRRFVEDFMEARILGAESVMADLLSPDARRVYQSGEGGLSLYGPTHDPGFRSLEYRIVDSANPDEQGGGRYYATVEVTSVFEGGRTTSITEALLLGPGISIRGEDLPLVVLRAQVVTPDPAPTDEEVGSLVTAFLDARLEGSGAQRFLTEVAASQYARHDGGLYLYGEEHQPGLGSNYNGGGIVSTEAVDAKSFQVVVALTLGDEEIDRTIHETLFVGLEQSRLMIRGAQRND